jgi:hypothetical protein
VGASRRGRFGAIQGRIRHHQRWDRYHAAFHTDGSAGDGNQLTQVQLQWAASTDNVGVDHYRIERLSHAGTVHIDTQSNQPTTYTDTTASANVAYRYRVLALDAAGNPSLYSDPDLATTLLFAEDPLQQGSSAGLPSKLGGLPKDCCPRHN